MEIYVERDRYNPLLKRRELHLRISFKGPTPSRQEVRQKVAGLMNAELDRVIVDYIKTEFGKMEAKCYVKIYDTVDDLMSIEEKHIIMRNFGKKEEEGEEGGGE